MQKPRPLSNHRQSATPWGLDSTTNSQRGGTPGSGLASYAVLSNDTPSECGASCRKGGLPHALPVSVVHASPDQLYSPAANIGTANNSIPILGGSGVGITRQNAEPTGFGASRVGGGFGGQRSSFMPSSSALGASAYNPGMTNGPRPSRHMNQSELAELKDYLWKASMSGPVRYSSTGKLSFYKQDFSTSQCTEKHHDTTEAKQDEYDDTAFMPLPRESVAIMVDAVRTSSLADDEKCRFLFEMFDVDNKGVLTKEGVRAFLEATFAANGIDFLGELDGDAVVDKVFAHARSPDKLTYGEFKKIFGTVVTESDDQKSKEKLGSLNTVTEETSSRENNSAKDKATTLIAPQEKGGRWYRFKKFYRMYSGEIFWVTLYIALMVGVAIAKGSRFGYDPAVKYCPRIAKGFAQICLVNTMFVLMPMCRNVVTALRTLPIVVNHLPVDQHIEFHKICGITMFIAGLGHTAAWLAIVYYVRTVPLEVWKESRYYHLSFVRDESLFDLALRIPVWTGVVMVLFMFIAAPLCHPKFRRSNFNIFFITHMLLILFIMLMMLHGVAAWVAAPQAYWWIAPPILIYFIEKRYRMAHMFGGRTVIVDVQHSKEAVAIFMKKPKSFGKRRRFQPGMYMFINVPVISQFEWHPFTISSAPEDKYLSLHIRKAGDWTGALYTLLEQLHAQNKSNQLEAQGAFTGRQKSPYPYVYIDGPMGAPAQDYTRYKEVVLIGAGIGVTPFASILKNILHQWETFRCPHCKHVRFPPSFQLRKIYFYWITREQEALAWFANTMNQLSEMDTENRLEIHNYFTSVKNKSVIAPLQALQNFIHETEGEDIISGLHTKQQTHFGRPDWKQELERVAANHRAQFGGNGEVGTDDEDDDENDREEIGVFFCGPKPLGNVIHEQCAQFNQSKIRWTPDVMFDFHSENF